MAYGDDDFFGEDDGFLEKEGLDNQNVAPKYEVRPAGRQRIDSSLWGDDGIRYDGLRS